MEGGVGRTRRLGDVDDLECHDNVRQRKERAYMAVFAWVTRQ
jgi:hypothetical protein